MNAENSTLQNPLTAMRESHQRLGRVGVSPRYPESDGSQEEEHDQDCQHRLEHRRPLVLGLFLSEGLGREGSQFQGGTIALRVTQGLHIPHDARGVRFLQENETTHVSRQGREPVRDLLETDSYSRVPR